MSYLLKIVKNTKNTKKITADGLVNETSALMRRVLEAAAQDDLEEAVASFYLISAFAKTVLLAKNTNPRTIEDAREYADAHEYYLETLKEASSVVQAMLSVKYGNLVPAETVQRMATYASEAKNLTVKKITKHIASLFPTPRKQTTNKRGGKRG